MKKVFLPKTASKFTLTLVCSLLFIIVFLAGCENKADKTLVKVRLNEVVRSVFYAPMYAAINQGFFKEEGLDIDLSTGQGADAQTPKTQVCILIP